jgi:tetratricopeptide (TPR) repeat protein
MSSPAQTTPDPSLGHHLRQMIPVWGIVLATAVASLFGLRWQGASFLERGFHQVEDRCPVGEIRYLAGRRVWEELTTELAARQLENQAASALGAFRGDERLATARSHFEEALQLCPSLPGPHLLMADAEWWEGNEARAHYHLGEHEMQAGRADQARVEFEVANALDPADHAIALRLGEAAAILERWDQVASVLESVPPAEGRAQRLRIEARLAAHQGDLAAALAHLRESLTLEPGHADSLATVADYSLRTGDPVGGARFLVENLARATTPDARSFHRAALLLMGAGEWAEAVGAIDQALALAPNSVVLYFDRARCLSSMGDYDGARLSAEDAITRDFRIYQDLVNQTGSDPRERPEG